jgi:hypothetical protein
MTMRKGLWLAGLLAALGGARQAAAQNPVNWTPVTATTNFTFNPNPLLNPISQPQQVSYGFRLLNLFPSGPNLSITPTVGTTTYPLQAEMPGRLYLSAFGMHQYGMRRPWWQWW